MVDTIIVQLREVDFQLIAAATGLTARYPILRDGVFIAAELLIYGFALFLFYLWERPELRARHHGSRKAVIMAIMSTVVAISLKTLIGVLYFRNRPFISHPELEVLGLNVHDSSFPSAHTLIVFSLAASLLFSGYKRIGTIALLAATLVGLARIFAGVHYPSDVLAGAFIGIGTAWYLHREASSLKGYLPDH